MRPPASQSRFVTTAAVTTEKEAIAKMPRTMFVIGTLLLLSGASISSVSKLLYVGKSSHADAVRVDQGITEVVPGSDDGDKILNDEHIPVDRGPNTG